MNIYVVRHGETAWNLERKVQGAADIPLNEKGLRLARLTGEALRDVPFAFAVSSPLKRAYETAKCILAGRDIPLTTDERIREISFGEMEGTSPREAGSPFARTFDDFFHRPQEYVPPKGGESLESVCRRTGEFLTELIEGQGGQEVNILVTSHGCAVRAMLQRFYPEGEDFWHGQVPPNCCVNRIEVRNGQARLVEEDRVYYEDI